MPVVLDLDGDGVDLANTSVSGIKFDWDGDGVADRTGWFSAGDAVVGLNRDMVGTIAATGEISLIDDAFGSKFGSCVFRLHQVASGDILLYF